MEPFVPDHLDLLAVLVELEGRDDLVVAQHLLRGRREGGLVHLLDLVRP